MGLRGEACEDRAMDVLIRKVIQNRMTTDSVGKPKPFVLGNFQTVVLMGAVGAAAKMHQLLRLISPQISQQVHFARPRHHLRWDIWHMFHLRSDIKIAEGLSE